MCDNGELVALVNTGGGINMLVSARVDCPQLGCDLADVAGFDCRVTLDDLATVLADFGETGPFLAGDSNFDEVVDLSDLASVLSSFGLDCNQ